jgi:hypothetical protein
LALRTTTRRVLRVGAHRPVPGVAVVGDAQRQSVRAQVGGRRSPGEQGGAVDVLRRESRAGRQGVEGEGQRVFLDVRSAHVETERFARHGDLVADPGELRRFVGNADADHEAARAAEGSGGAAAITVVRGSHGKHVVAPVGRPWREAEHAAAAAVVGKGGEGRQAGSRQGERVAVGVGDDDRHFDDLVAVQRAIGHLGNVRRLVGVEYRDRHTQRRYAGRPGAVAIVAGSEAGRIGAGLHEARRPHEHRGLGVEGRAGRQADRGVGDGRLAFEQRCQQPVGQAVLRDEARVFGVEGEGAEEERLPFAHLPFAEPVEFRQTVDVEHRDRRRDRGGRGAVADRERDVVGAGLSEAWRPFEFTGMGVEEGAAGKEAARVVERRAFGVAGGKLDADRVALAYRALGRREQRRRLVDRANGQVEADAVDGQAVADGEGDAAVIAGGGEARRPGERLPLGVDDGAAGEVVGKEGQAVAIGVGGHQRHFEELPLVDLDAGRQIEDLWRVVDAGQGNGERLAGVGAAAVVGTQYDVCLLGAGESRRPGNDAGQHVDRHSLRAALQQVADGTAAGVAGQGGVGIGLTGTGRGERRRLECRRCVRCRHGIDAMADLDTLPEWIADRNRVGERGLAGVERAVGQRLFKLDQPEAEGVRAVGIDRLTLEVARRVERKDDRRQQVAVADVGDAHVVGDGAVGTRRAGVQEVDAHVRRQVDGGGEAGVVGGAQCRTEAAGKGTGDVQREAVRRQRVEAQRDAAGRRVVAGRADRHGARGGAGQRVVGEVQHRACLARIVGRHVLIEGDRQARQRQRRGAQVRRIGADHARRETRRDAVDLMRLGDQQGAIGGGHHVLAARAALGDAQVLESGEVDHLQLAVVGGDEQQPGKRRTRPAEGQRVYLGVETNDRLPATERAELDERAALGPGRTPQLAGWREREVVDARFAERLENPGGGVEDRHPATCGHVDLAAFRVDG